MVLFCNQINIIYRARTYSYRRSSFGIQIGLLENFSCVVTPGNIMNILRFLFFHQIFDLVQDFIYQVIICTKR